MSVGENQLPFSTHQQDALLGHFLINEKLFKQVKDKILPQWFINMWASKVWGAWLAFWKRYGRIPSDPEFLDSEAFFLENQASRTAMQAKLIEARKLTETYKLDVLLPQLTNWLHARAFQEGVQKSSEFYNKGKTAEAYQLMHEKMAFIKNTNFLDDASYDFEAMTQNMERRQTEIKGAMSFGVSAMDRAILPMGKGEGSLLPGDTTLMIAPTNVGKTSCMITTIAHNIRRGKSALVLTHEGVQDDIAEKIFCSVMGVTKPELYAMPTDREPKRRDLYYTVQKILAKNLKYIPMNKSGLCIEDVDGVIRRAQEDRQAHIGRGFDLLMDDYPAKLWSNQVTYGQFQKRNLDEYIYNYFVQLALEYKFHSLIAQQANRTAAKINRGQKGFEERLMNAEDGNESYGPAQIATNVITINRGPMDEILGFTTFYLCKSRSNEKNWAIVCKSNYGACVTHSDSLGYTYYRGNVPLGDYIEPAFNRYRNQEIPSFRDADEIMAAARGVQAQAAMAAP